MNWWITSVSDKQDKSAREFLRELLEFGWYLLGDSTPGRKQMSVGDKICYHLKGEGVAAEATVASAPTKHVPPEIQSYSYGKFSWSLRIHSSRLFLDKPIVIDAALRERLEAFHDRDLTNPKSWVWFVQMTHKISQKDFRLLTGGWPDSQVSA